MDSTRYVQITCSACGGKIVAVIGQPRPATCALCKEPLEPLPPPSGNGRQTETGTRGPATFSRGTFKNTGSKKPPSSNRPSSGVPKAPGAPPTIADLKKKFLSLFTPRS